MAVDQPDSTFRVIQIIAWVVTAIAAVALAPLKWMMQRAVDRLEAHATRIETLERNTVSYEELQAALKQLRDEAREERTAMHGENTRHLNRIELKIDTGEQRHIEIRASVQNIATKVAVLADRSKRNGIPNIEDTQGG